jgi:hypothetical protein
MHLMALKRNLQSNPFQAEMAVEILSISVNQELVKHSLLTRKIIKADKDIETIQSEYAPKATKVKNFFRICRVSLCSLFFKASILFCA